jgi:hypothetical protein
MKAQPLAPEERAYLREVIGSVAGHRWMSALINLRPAIAGKTNEERSMSASEAIGYERAVSNMGMLLEDPIIQPEVKQIDIRTD